MEHLIFKTKQVCRRVAAVLQRLDHRRSLQFLSMEDKYRLTVLLVWEERYQVPLEWMTEKLYHFYAKARRGGKYSGRRALPVRVNSFVSKASLEFLKETMANEISRDLPRLRQQLLIHKMVRQELVPSPRGSLFDFDSVQEYVQHYRDRIGEARRLQEELLRKRRIGAKPYRGSPIFL